MLCEVWALLWAIQGSQFRFHRQGNAEHGKKQQGITITNPGGTHDR